MSEEEMTLSESARWAAAQIELYMAQQEEAARAAGFPPQPAPMDDMAMQMANITPAAGDSLIDAALHSPPFFITGLTVFVLSCIVGYYVVWRVTPALHSPLMGITNAISSVIIVGALMAAGAAASMTSVPSLFGFAAVVLASVNIFGGFIITRRMLHMFKKKV